MLSDKQIENISSAIAWTMLAIVGIALFFLAGCSARPWLSVELSVADSMVQVGQEFSVAVGSGKFCPTGAICSVDQSWSEFERFVDFGDGGGFEPCAAEKVCKHIYQAEGVFKVQAMACYQDDCFTESRDGKPASTLILVTPENESTPCITCAFENNLVAIQLSYPNPCPVGQCMITARYLVKQDLESITAILEFGNTGNSGSFDNIFDLSNFVAQESINHAAGTCYDRSPCIPAGTAPELTWKLKAQASGTVILRLWSAIASSDQGADFWNTQAWGEIRVGQ